MKNNKTLYDVLQVSRGASNEVIRSAYEVLKRECVEAGDQGGRSVNELETAYSILGDPERRHAYDQALNGSASESRNEERGTAETGMSALQRVYEFVCIAGYWGLVAAGFGVILFVDRFWWQVIVYGAIAAALFTLGKKRRAEDEEGVPPFPYPLRNVAIALLVAFVPSLIVSIGIDKATFDYVVESSARAYMRGDMAGVYGRRNEFGFYDTSAGLFSFLLCMSAISTGLLRVARSLVK